MPWSLPSQFLENYAWHPEVLRQISGHYQTGAPLPGGDPVPSHLDTQLPRGPADDAAARIRPVRFPDARRNTHRKAAVASWRSLNEVRREVAVVPAPEWNRFPNSFGHIFAGGYAAGYYSYKWAEVLAADAFSAFEETGVFDHSTAQRFLDSILTRGGSRDALEAFIEFRGRRPDVRALLKQHGIDA